MYILAIDTSCDETSVAITFQRKVLVNEIYSQILIHKKWGGVVPALAKRAHQERIDYVIEEAIKKFKNQNSKFKKNIEDKIKKIDFIAVTYGPGLAPALEVGINKAKELANRYNKKIIPVNHMEGHLYSPFCQNRHGNPVINFNFPYLALLVSGGHTELVILKDHLNYEVIGQTIDDAAGEALDKAAKLLGLGYPGGPVIERLAKNGDPNFHFFPRPLFRSNDLNFSFSGLKTSFYYFLKKMKSEERIKNLNNLASSFQEAVFEALIKKLEQGIKKTGIKRIIGGGGVMSNHYLRKKIRSLVKKYNGELYFPPLKLLYGDNAGIIGVAAYFKAKKGIIVRNLAKLDRAPRLKLGDDEGYLVQP